jgi:hypothetical protein
MEAFYQLQDASKAAENWKKIQTRHKATMKKVLDEEQYKKYLATFELTVKNAANRTQDQQLARK